MADATSIQDLPPMNSNTQVQQQQQQQPPSSVSLDQQTISQIVNGLQQASLAGVTSLPSRDIPTSTDTLTTDPHAQQSFIPAGKQYVIPDSNMYCISQPPPQQPFQDEMYIAVLVAVLYFIFQLPIVKKTIFKQLTFLCHDDGNYNINGLVTMSALFGAGYYSFKYFTSHPM